LLKLAALPAPVIWPDAAGLLEGVAEGDASAADTLARDPAGEPFAEGPSRPRRCSAPIAPRARTPGNGRGSYTGSKR
jgi:hypothetical protein